MPTLEWIVPEDSNFWPCPNGCGGATDDDAGGPCTRCWNGILDGECTDEEER